MFRVTTILAMAVGLALSPIATLPGDAAPSYRGLAVSTTFPSQSWRTGDTVVLTLSVKNFNLPPQVVNLRVDGRPAGWRTSFFGGGRTVNSVYVAPDSESIVSLRLTPPQGVKPGTYRFRMVAQGQGASASLAVELSSGGTVSASRLSLETELPTLRGPVSSAYRFRVTLRNDSDQDQIVNLDYSSQDRATVTFSTSGQQVTQVPVKAGEQRDLDTEVNLRPDTKAGSYDVVIKASAGGTTAETKLTAVVTGKPELTVSSSDGRLSGNATAGQPSPIKVVVENRGSAPAKNVEFSSSEPTGWGVKFEPNKIQEIAPLQKVEVTANVRPGGKAIAGDYMVTMRANAGDTSSSADFRVNVRTSNLWGIVAIALIAGALLVVSQVVSKYGRR